jgi:hypothetical protein
MLVLASIWSLRQISLDALPDISDVEVIVQTEWTGEPPTIIEDQLTYPIVTSLLAAPLCRAAGGKLEQIQLLLGHASVQTTERYLGTRQNLVDAPNDGIKLRVVV